MRPMTMAEAVVHGRGTERPFLCPVHGDSRPSASLNIIKQKWICYTCGAHGALTGEAALMEPDYQVLKQWFIDKLEEHRVYPEAWLSRWDAGPVHPYWLHRVGESAARHFRLGFDADRNAVTYPLRGTDQSVLGVVRRSLERDTDGPKYHYPRGVDVGRLLFNYRGDRRATAVVLCEGALDAVALWNVGVPTALAIYGSRLSAAQVQLIDRLDPLYVFTCFDADDAGYRAHCAVEQAMRHRLVGRITWPASWGKDIDELSPEQRRRVLPRQLVQESMLCIESSACGSSKPGTRKPSSSSASTSKRSGLRILRSAS